MSDSHGVAGSHRTAARTADVAISVVLMVAGAIGFGMLAVLSPLLLMMSDGCHGDNCDTGLMTIGWLIATIAPPAVFIATVVRTIIRLARRKIAWWPPVAGGALALVIWVAGVFIMDAGFRR